MVQVAVAIENDLLDLLLEVIFAIRAPTSWRNRILVFAERTPLRSRDNVEAAASVRPSSSTTTWA